MLISRKATGDGYRAVVRTGETRVFMALRPGDTSYDWLDVTDQVKAGYFIVCERDWKSAVGPGFPYGSSGLRLVIALTQPRRGRGYGLARDCVACP
jgi:hypothetical protein